MLRLANFLSNGGHNGSFFFCLIFYTIQLKLKELTILYYQGNIGFDFIIIFYR